MCIGCFYLLAISFFSVCWRFLLFLLCYVVFVHILEHIVVFCLMFCVLLKFSLFLSSGNYSASPEWQIRKDGSRSGGFIRELESPILNTTTTAVPVILKFFFNLSTNIFKNNSKYAAMIQVLHLRSYF